MPSDCSLLITTWNEEQFLEDCLTWSRNAFSDVVILDNQSTDRTVEIAEKFGCRVFQEEPEPEDNWAAGIRTQIQNHAKYDWVFHCDADERICWNMLQKITYWTKPDCPERIVNVVAFKFPRYNWCGRAWDDPQIRLVNKNYVGWRRPIHPEAILKRTGKPVDEFDTVNGKTVQYSQKLSMHVIYHLNRPLDQLQRTRERWSKFEERFGVKPPVDSIVVESVPVEAEKFEARYERVRT